MKDKRATIDLIRSIQAPRIALEQAMLDMACHTQAALSFAIGSAFVAAFAVAAFR